MFSSNILATNTFLVTFKPAFTLSASSNGQIDAKSLIEGGQVRKFGKILVNFHEEAPKFSTIIEKTYQKKRRLCGVGK
jgi:hypothetical protein